MIFKCKMCGGALKIPKNNDVFQCLYCGTTQTLPTFNDERKNNLYDRANHLRQSGNFDKAISIYEIILEQDSKTHAEKCLQLCKKKLAEIKAANELKLQAKEQEEENRRIAEEIRRKKKQKNDLIIGIAVTLTTIGIVCLAIFLAFKMADPDKTAAQSLRDMMMQNRIVTAISRNGQ